MWSSWPCSLTDSYRRGTTETSTPSSVTALDKLGKAVIALVCEREDHVAGAGVSARVDEVIRAAEQRDAHGDSGRARHRVCLEEADRAKPVLGPVQQPAHDVVSAARSPRPRSASESSAPRGAGHDAARIASARRAAHSATAVSSQSSGPIGTGRSAPRIAAVASASSAPSEHTFTASMQPSIADPCNQPTRRPRTCITTKTNDTSIAASSASAAEM